MKVQLLKSMPHVPLPKLRPALQEQNAQNNDQAIEDLNAVGGQDNIEDPGNDVDSTDYAFQYCPHNQQRNDVLDAGNWTTRHFRKVFRKVVVNRHRKIQKGERAENVGHNISYGNNENSESDNEEDFQEGIPLVQRTQRI